MAHAAYPRDWRRAAAVRPSAEGTPLACLALLLLGVAWPQALPPAPVGSCPTFSPLPLRAVCFCGPAPRVAAPGRYPAACSVEFGLSSGGSKSARDHLTLFGAIIVALAMIHVKVIFNARAH